MIGNDIVDLSLARSQSNWKRKGWLEKIFTIDEINLIQNSCRPEQMVWILWSRKEAAYKAHQRLSRCKSWYQPKNISCNLYSDTVYIDKYTFLATTESTSDYIYSQAYFNNKINYSQICPGEKAKIKVHLLNYISSHFFLQKEHLEIRKDSCGIPYVYYKNQSFNFPFSLTHHGKYAAFSM